MPLKLLEDPLEVARVKECVFTAMLDGYTAVVYNFVRNGQS